MKHNILIISILALALTSCQYRRQQPSPSEAQAVAPRGVRLVGTNPVKDQGNSSLCWLYGMMSTIESEHIRQGDSVNLSTAYIARMMLGEKAVAYYLSRGTKPISMRGMAPMLIHYIYKYGAIPYDSYEDPKNINYQVLTRKVEYLCRNAIAQRVGLEKLRERLDALFDQEMGYLPANTVHMLGAEYTPQEFAHSVCYPGEYVSFTSFTHHPFGQRFALEVPDNQDNDTFTNVPLEQLMGIIRKAVSHGYPVCWEGDISEPEFRQTKDGYVDLPSSASPVTQLSRQQAFERLLTTDDHVMEIIGMFRHGNHTYYVCRNSWGEQWQHKGHIYLSEDYLRLKTIAICLSKDAL